MIELKIKEIRRQQQKMQDKVDVRFGERCCVTIFYYSFQRKREKEKLSKANSFHGNKVYCLVLLEKQSRKIIVMASSKIVLLFNIESVMNLFIFNQIGIKQNQN